MASYYAKNIQWSDLLADNTVEATFDVYDDADVLIASAVKASGSPSDIQLNISNALKSKASAVATYEAIKQNTVLEVPMV